MTDQQHHQAPSPAPVPLDEEGQLRERALKHLKAKRDLKGHVLAYVLVNLLLVAIWYTTGSSFFWPIFIILGWGIGLAFNIYDVVSPEPGRAEVQAEMERMRQHR